MGAMLVKEFLMQRMHGPALGALVPYVGFQRGRRHHPSRPQRAELGRRSGEDPVRLVQGGGGGLPPYESIEWILHE